MSFSLTKNIFKDMKLYTCIAHAEPSKINILAKVLQAQEKLTDEVHVCVITNATAHEVVDAIYACGPTTSKRFKLDVYNKHCDSLPSPWLLTWVHKKLMLEKFHDPTYTHFMCIEDDMEFTVANLDYWLKDREILKPFNLYPSFLRVEWNFAREKWAAADSLSGDVFSFTNSPHIEMRTGHSFINLGRTYQGMFLYDRDLMEEHINSISFDLLKFVPNWQERIRHVNWPRGLTEKAVIGISHINVPPGCYSRNFTPIFPKYLLFDPCCFVHHLTDKYTNLPDVPNGKVMVDEMLTA